MTDLIEAPKWGDVVELTIDDPMALPDVPHPYYIQAEEGFFKHQRNATGRWITKSKTPNRIKALGNKEGYGRFDADRIPAHIYAQAVDFFKRIWHAHKTEAEVIITQHRDTKEYRLFVPTQRVSHGGVTSIYNPAHIDPNYLVVGTFHSHCDMSAFHSSTDEGDASDMDGIHGTVGYVNREVPELAVMVAASGVLFNFKDVTEVVDTSDLSASKAPLWWDRYMVFHQVTDAERPDWVDDKTWDAFMWRNKDSKRYNSTPKKVDDRHWGWDDDDLASWLNSDDAEARATGYSQSTIEWMRANGYTYDSDMRTFRWSGTGTGMDKDSVDFNTRRSHLRSLAAPKNDKLVGDDEDYWEDTLGQKFVSDMFQTGLFTEDDLDKADDMPAAGTEAFWLRVFEDKLTDAAAFLTKYGVKVKVNISWPAPMKVVKGQTGIDDFIEGELQ